MCISSPSAPAPVATPAVAVAERDEEAKEADAKAKRAQFLATGYNDLISPLTGARGVEERLNNSPRNTLY